MPVKRKLRLRPVKKKERMNNGEMMAGGIATIGYTAELNGLVKLEKDIYGQFDDIGYGTDGQKGYVEWDVRDNSPALPICNPVFSHRDLIKIYLQSTILRQCVEAYRVNIEGYGHDLEYIGPEGKQDSLAARNEFARLNRVLDNLTTDGRTLQKHREDSRHDLEILGARAFEISQDLVGRTVIFNHVPVHTLRMTKRERQPVLVPMINPVTGGTYLVPRRFRRFLQITEDRRKIWFKEYGDPRTVDPTTGKDNPALPIEDQATSIYYEALYTPGTPYGTPRWAGAIPALLGSREAEMVNLNFFRDNAIPALAVLVSGGALTEESFNKIEQYIQGVRGQKSMNRIVVLEATTDTADTAAIDGSLPAPKVDIKPMLSERQHEGLFANYIEATEEKTRSSFRLPPIYTGVAKDYNRASAFASMLTADQQIFIPERIGWDTMFANVVLSTHNPKYWRLRSLGPALSDPQEVARIVTTLSNEGGLTPNIAIKLANRYLDVDVETVTDEWGDLPFSVILQYIKSGRVIKGLDIFIDNMGEAGQLSGEGSTSSNPGDNSGEDDPNAGSSASTEQMMRYGVATMLDELSESLRRDVQHLVLNIGSDISDEISGIRSAIIDYNDANKIAA